MFRSNGLHGCARFAGALLALFALSACTNSPTTPTGPLAEIDLRAQLPSGVTSPTDALLKTRTAKTTICNGDEKHPGAEIQITWKTFENGADAYVAHASFAVTKSADALAVTLGTHAEVGSANLGAGEPYREIVLVTADCARKTFRYEQTGTDMISFDAEGKILTPNVILHATSR
jgi:hypothetical protein